MKMKEDRERVCVLSFIARPHMPNGEMSRSAAAAGERNASFLLVNDHKRITAISVSIRDPRHYMFSLQRPRIFLKKYHYVPNYQRRRPANSSME